MLWLAVAFGAGMGGFVQAVTGFGSAVVMMTVLPYFFSMVDAVALSNSICLGIALMMAARYWRKVSIRLILLPTTLYDLASMIVISRLGNVDMRLLTACFGVFLMLLSLYFLFAAKDTAFKITLPRTIVLGILAGICDGLFSIGGPIMAIYFLEVTKDRESYLANIQMHFAINNTLTLATRIANEFYTLKFLPLTMVGLLGVLLGQNAGLRVSRFMNAAAMRRVVYIYVGVSGLITLVQQLV